MLGLKLNHVSKRGPYLTYASIWAARPQWVNSSPPGQNGRYFAIILQISFNEFLQRRKSWRMWIKKTAERISLFTLVCNIHSSEWSTFAAVLFTENINTLTSTHWGRDKMSASLQTTFSNAFSGLKLFEFRLKLHWRLSQRVTFTKCQHWFREWLDAKQATGQYLNQWWPMLSTHKCVTRPQYVNCSSW